ncbi:hypothetical protein HanIR_Chr17g0866601 [Helianthus annuus]|nr:hypothetical protein HanIR_Chr17g0866601 [Helianthus annuus]
MVELKCKECENFKVQSHRLKYYIEGPKDERVVEDLDLPLISKDTRVSWSKILKKTKLRMIGSLVVKFQMFWGSLEGEKLRKMENLMKFGTCTIQETFCMIWTLARYDGESLLSLCHTKLVVNNPVNSIFAHRDGSSCSLGTRDHEFD